MRKYAKIPLDSSLYKDGMSVFRYLVVCGALLLFLGLPLTAAPNRHRFDAVPLPDADGPQTVAPAGKSPALDKPKGRKRYGLDVAQVHRSLSKTRGKKIEARFRFDDELDWDMELEPVDQLADNFVLRISGPDGIEEHPKTRMRQRTYRGRLKSKPGSSVRLTASDRYVSAVIRDADGETYGFGSKDGTGKDAAASNEVWAASYRDLPKKGRMAEPADWCGHPSCSGHKKARPSTGPSGSLLAEPGLRGFAAAPGGGGDGPIIPLWTSGETYELEYAFAVDYLFLSHFADIDALTDYLLDVLNRANAYYDDFGVTYKLVEIFVSTDLENEPWSGYVDKGTALTEFDSWVAAGGFHRWHDLATIWTGVQSGYSLAWLGTVGRYGRHNICEYWDTFSTNPQWAASVLTHESGHNWGAIHVSPGPTVMSPYIYTGVLTWHASTAAAFTNSGGFIDVAMTYLTTNGLPDMTIPFMYYEGAGGDGVVDPGETTDVSVAVINIGAFASTGTIDVVVTPDAGYTNLVSPLSFSTNVIVGTGTTVNASFVIDVDASFPVFSNVTFQFTYSEPSYTQVMTRVERIGKRTVLDHWYNGDSGDGDNDAVIEGGETGNLNVVVANTGNIPATNLTISIALSDRGSAHAVLNGSTQQVFTLGAEASTSMLFSVTAPSSMPTGLPTRAVFALQEGVESTAKTNWLFLAPDQVVSEDFEDTPEGELPAGWTEVLGDPVHPFTVAGSEWVFNEIDGDWASGSYGGTQSLFTGESWYLGFPRTQQIITPPIELRVAEAAELEYFELRGWDNTWPVAKPTHVITVEASENTIGPWSTLGTITAHDSDFQNWRSIQAFDLSSQVGKRIYLRFTDNAHHYYWRFDNFVINVAQSTNELITSQMAGLAGIDAYDTADWQWGDAAGKTTHSYLDVDGSGIDVTLTAVGGSFSAATNTVAGRHQIGVGDKEIGGSESFTLSLSSPRLIQQLELGWMYPTNFETGSMRIIADGLVTGVVSATGSATNGSDWAVAWTGDGTAAYDGGTSTSDVSLTIGGSDDIFGVGPVSTITIENHAGDCNAGFGRMNWGATKSNLVMWLEGITDDGVLEPGETGQFEIGFYNNGSGSSVGTLSVEATQPAAYTGLISVLNSPTNLTVSGATETNLYALIQVDPSFPNTSDVELRFTLVEGGQTQTLYTTTRIGKFPDFAVSYQGDASDTDGDFVIEAGETGNVVYQLDNIGEWDVSDAKVSLTLSDRGAKYVTVNTSTQTVASLDEGESTSLSFSLTLSSNMYAGLPTYACITVENYGQTSTFSNLLFLAPRVIYNETFEDSARGQLPTGWTEVLGDPGSSFTVEGNQGVGDPAGPDWTSTPYNGTNTMFTDENWYAGSAKGQRLITGPIDLNSAEFLEFEMAELRAWDNSWPAAKPIHTVYLQSGSSSNGPWTTVGSISANDDDFRSWLNVQKVDISTEAGQVVYLSFLTTTHIYYWRLDDIVINALGGFPIEPIVDNSGGATGVTTTTAWLNGTLQTNGVDDAEVWVYWGSSDGGTNPAAWGNTNYFGTNSLVTPRNYTKQVTVASNGVHYYRYRAANVEGDSWAPETATFSTVPVYLLATDASASEAPDSGAFEVSRPVGASTGSMTVYYTISGTASNGLDYRTLEGSVLLPDGEASVVITIDPHLDALSESNETVTLTLADGGYIISAQAEGTVTISDVENTGVLFVDQDATGANDGSSWYHAFVSITNAVSGVNTGGQIWVAEGTYNPGETLALADQDVTIYGGFDGTENQLSQRDTTNHVVALDGVNARRVLNVSAANVTLDGLTVTRGSSRDYGGIYNTGENLTLRDCVVSACRAGNGGNGDVGGIYSSKSMRILDSLIENNDNTSYYTQNGRSGGVFLTGTGTLLVSNTVFRSNKSQIFNSGTWTHGNGGAIYMEGNGTLLAYNCIFDANEADAHSQGGGAIYRQTSGGSNSIVNCTFYGNTSTRYGAAIYSSGSPLNIVNSIFWGNTASYASGKQIYAGAGTVTIDHGSFPSTNAVDIYTTGTLTINNVITNDPQFADAAGHDFHLKSAYGRWTSAGWTNDALTSACIDAGNPDSVYTEETEPRGAAINLGAYGNTHQASRSATLPSIANASSGATGLSDTTATLNGTLRSTANAATEVWVYWGETNGGTNASAWANTNYFGTNSATPLVAYATNLTALTPSTSYFYTYRASNSNGTDWATPSMPFSTSGRPTVSNAPAATVGIGTATLSGTVTDTNGAPILVAHIYWGTSDGGTNAGSWANTNVFDAGSITENVAYSTNLTGFLYGQTYTYRAYVSNTYGEAWADTTDTFLTSPAGGLTVTDGLALWLKADAGIQTNGSGAVTNWIDQSGSDHDAYVTDGTVDYEASANSGGMPGVDFGSGDRMRAGAAWSLVQPYTVFIVYDSDSTSTAGRRALAGSNNWLIGPYQNHYAHYALGWVYNSETMPSDQYIIATALNDGQTDFYIDGTSKASGGSGGSPGSVFLGTTSEPLLGDIGEVIIYTNTLSAAELDDVGGYLADKYGLSTDYTDPLPAPSLSNLPATGMTTNSVVLNATLTGADSYWDTVTAHYWEDGSATTNTVSDGPYTVTDSTNLSLIVTGLSQNTLYWYTFQATNVTTNLWASPAHSLMIAAPTVTNAPAATVGVGSVTLSGTVTAFNSPSLEVARIYWGDNDGGATHTWDNTAVFDGGAISENVAFATNLTGLLYGKRYYYRTYASNSYGEAWADADTFLTDPPSGGLGDVITGVTATSDNNFYANATKAVDWSGMSTGSADTNATQDANYPNMWTPNNALTSYIQFDLQAVYDVAKIFLWQYNQAGYPGQSVATANIYYSETYPGQPAKTSTTGWTLYDPANYPWPQATLTGTDYTVVDMNTALTARYIEIDPLTKNGGGPVGGLSEILFFGAGNEGVTLVNSAATDLTTNSAVLNATLTAANSYWDTVTAHYWEDGSSTTNTVSGGAYTVTDSTNLSLNVTGLSQNTLYWYTFQATNAATNLWASPALSLMLAAPTVTNAPAATVGIGSATLSGTVTAFNTPSLDAVRIYWGDNDGGATHTWDNTAVFDAGSISENVAFATNLTGLLYGKTYYYRAYASNSLGEAWSAADSFLTEESLGAQIFTNSGVYVSSGGSVEVLVVGGGGSGGWRTGAGGGAGGLIYTQNFSVVAGSNYTVTVGAGGAAKTSDQAVDSGNDGGNSAFGSLIAIGGGGGGGNNTPANGRSGGSGGGGDRAGAGGAGTAGQGYAGGNGNGNYGGGGGGGAGGPGLGGLGGGIGADGGPGVTKSITGTPVVYAAGGGGGSWSTATEGAGGSDGVGGRGSSTDVNATAGAPHTGSGGGGGGGGDSDPSRHSGAGGDGIVIVSCSALSIDNQAATDLTTNSAVLNATLTAAGSYWNTVTAHYWADGSSTTNTVSGGPYTVSDATNLSFSATGLSLDTTYWFTFQAANAATNLWASPALSFATAGLPPVIDSLTPTSCYIGDTVTIAGSNFGSVQGASTVTFSNGLSAAVSYWSDTSITCTVPYSAVSGPVTVNTLAGTSNGKQITLETAPANTMKITFSGYDKPETLTNFPALVSLYNNVGGSYFDYDTTVSSDGYELRFWDATESQELNYEIEEWNTGGVSYVWVQVPELVNSNTYIWAKWGDATAGQQVYTTNGATWSNGYEAVWHFAGNLEDSTSHERDGIDYNGTVNTNSGAIGDARSFSAASSQYVATASGYKGIIGTAPRTMEAWVNANTGAGTRAILAWGNNWTGQAYLWRLGNGIHQVNDDQSTLSGSTDIRGSGWRYLAAVGDGTANPDSQLYLDGANEASGNISINTFGNGDPRVKIGANETYNGLYWDGMLDEVRLSSVVRSTNWLWASYQSQADPTTFQSYGRVTLEESLVFSLPTAQNVTETSAELLSTLSGTNADVKVFWDTTDKGTTLTWAYTNTPVTAFTNTAAGTTLTNTATGLAPDQPYFFRFYGVNTELGLTNWSAVGTFTTLPTTAAPEVTNAPAATVDVGTATLSGTVTATNGLPLDVVRIYWGDNDGGETHTWDNTASFDAGSISENAAFSTNLTGLLYGVQYHYRTYASNSVGETWANADTFLTEAAAGGLTLVNGAATDPTQDSAVLNATFTAENSYWDTVTAHYWEDGTTTTNTVSGGPYTISDSTNLSFSATGLSAGTTYWFTFQATNAATNVWASPALSFSTTNAPALAEVTLSATDTDAAEAGTDTGEFTVARDYGSTNAALTVYYAVSGTASNGVDYTNLTGSVTIQVGQTNATVTVTPVDDGLIEGSETVMLTLSAGGGYTIGSPSNDTVTITDDDLASVTLVATDAAATEAGQTTGAFTVTRSGSGPAFTNAALTVNYSISGTADNTDDYAVLSGSVSIGIGQTTATITVTPEDDSLIEGDETVILTVSANAAYTVGGASSDTVTIIDDDFTAPSVTNAPAATVDVGAATLSGTVTATNDLPLDVVRIYWGDNDGGETYVWDNTANFDAGLITQNVAFATNLTGLLYGQRYHYRTYASNSVGDAWAADDTFLTEPVVNQLSATNIYSSYLPTNPVTIFTDMQLSSVISAGGRMGGLSILDPDYYGAMYHYSNDGSTATYQLQVFENPHTKCVKVRLDQSGDDITGYVVYAKYWLNWNALGANFDTSGSVGTIATSSGAFGYGAATTELYRDWTEADVSLANGAADGITTNAAVLHAALAATNSYWHGVNAYYWEDGTTTTNTVSGGPYTISDSTNLSFSATGLSASTTYWFTFQATNDATNVWAATPLSYTTDAGVLATVTVSATTPSASESGPANGVFTVMRSNVATNEALTVNYSIGGTADNTDDYTTLSGSVSIGIGQTTATITVTPEDDSLIEGDETVTLTVSADAAYTVGGASSDTVTISDNDLPEVTLAATDTTATEASQTTGEFTVTRSGSGSAFTNAALTVNYSISGTADNTDDYAVLSGSVSIGIGQTTATITVTPEDDSLIEGNETVTLTVSADAAYTVGGASSDTVTISDNDQPEVTIAATDAAATEAGQTTGEFTVTRSGSGPAFTNAALTVNYSISGTADNTDDYAVLSGSVSIGIGQTTATITVTPEDDSLIEGSETVTLTVSADAAYTVGGASSDTVTISDNDLPEVTIAATDATATEASQTTGEFTVTRSGSGPAFTNAALTVNYSISGTADNTDDYAVLSGSVSIGIGQTTATITVTPEDDSLIEGSETVILTVSADAAYTVGGASSDTVTISDNDQPEVTIAATDATATEAGQTTGDFTVTRSGSGSGLTNAALTVNYSIGGTADNTDDYAVLSGSVSIGIGQTTATITVTPEDDSLIEGNETVTLTVSADAAYTVGGASSDTVTISDNDLPEVTIAATDATATEAGQTTGEFTVTRSGSGPAFTNAALTVNYSISGTADNTDDYAVLSGSVSIGIGQTTATITVTPEDDSLIEGDETVILTVSADAAYTVGGASSDTVTIADDDSSSGFPFLETFETADSGMASTLGPINAQHGWAASPTTAGVVTNGSAALGDQFCQTAGGSVTHDFSGSTNQIWVQLFAKPVWGPTSSVPADVSAGFCVDGSGRVNALSNGTWVIGNNVTVESNTWIRFTSQLDYDAMQWSLWRNTTPVVTDVPFYSKTRVTIEGMEVRDGPGTAFDHVLVTNGAPGLGLAVLGSGGTEIIDGDMTPTSSDGTDFGSHPSNQSVDRTFTITNASHAAISLTGNPRIVLSGANASSWQVLSQPAASIDAGGTSDFTLRLDAETLGALSATISFMTDAGEYAPYNFVVGASAEAPVGGNGRGAIFRFR